MGYCISCEKNVNSNKFCPSCGRQVMASKEAAAGADVTPAEQTASINSGSNLAMWAHLAPLLGAAIGTFTFFPYFVLWLPGLLIRNNQKATPFERAHGTESLNFQLSLLVYTVTGTAIGFATIFIGFLIIGPALLALAVAAIVFNIMAAVAGNAGREYRYPLTILFVK